VHITARAVIDTCRQRSRRISRWQHRAGGILRGNEWAGNAAGGMQALAAPGAERLKAGERAWCPPPLSSAFQRFLDSWLEPFLVLFPKSDSYQLSVLSATPFNFFLQMRSGGEPLHRQVHRIHHFPPMAIGPQEGATRIKYRLGYT
jgi:hypothetical protein